MLPRLTLRSKTKKNAKRKKGDEKLISLRYCTGYNQIIYNIIFTFAGDNNYII